MLILPLTDEKDFPESCILFGTNAATIQPHTPCRRLIRCRQPMISEKAIDACSRARDALTQFGEKADGPFARGLCGVGRGRLGQLWKIAQQFIQLSDRLAKRPDPWIARARHEVFTGLALTWSSRESATSKALESLGGVAASDENADMETPAGISGARLMADATDLLSHFEAGGGLGFWIFRARVVKRCAYVWRDSRFGGRQCDSPEVLKPLVARLRAQATLDRACHEWSDVVEPPSGTMRHRLAWLEQCPQQRPESHPSTQQSRV